MTEEKRWYGWEQHYSVWGASVEEVVSIFDDLNDAEKYAYVQTTDTAWCLVEFTEGLTDLRQSTTLAVFYPDRRNPEVFKTAAGYSFDLKVEA